MISTKTLFKNIFQQLKEDFKKYLIIFLYSRIDVKRLLLLQRKFTKIHIIITTITLICYH